MKTGREKRTKSSDKGVAVVPTEVSNFDFGEQASRAEREESPRRKVPLNPGPLPQGTPVPESEILNREDKD